MLDPVRPRTQGEDRTVGKRYRKGAGALGVDVENAGTALCFPQHEFGRQAVEARPPFGVELWKSLGDIGEFLCAASEQVLVRVRGQIARIGLREGTKHLVDDRAAIGSAGRHRDGVERIEFQDMARKNRIRIAHQDFDFGDAEAARKQSRVGTGRGPPKRAHGLRRVEHSGPIAIGVSRQNHIGPHRIARKSLEPLQEPRWHHGRSIALLRPCDHHVVGAQRLHEIVRGLADATLRRCETHACAHGSVEKRIRDGARRPGAFVETAEHNAIHRQQPCLQQSEDLDAAMRRAGGRTEILLFGQRGEEGRIIDKPPLQRLVFLRADFRHFEIVEKRRQRLDGWISILAFVVGWISAKCLDGTTVMFGQRDEVERALAVIRR